MTNKNKKLFISVPMGGRSTENIKLSMKKMHKIAEIILDEDLDVIESFNEKNKPKNVKEEIAFLGESIKKLAEADYVIGLYEIDNFAGCLIERDVALFYGIPYIRAFAEQVATDLFVANDSHQEETSFDADNLN